MKSSQALSKPEAKSAAVTPDATTAFISRAPSMWLARPFARAASWTERTCSSGQTRPPP